MKQKRWLWILLSLAMLVTVMLFLTWTEDSIDVKATESSPPLQPVSIETRTVMAETGVVSGFAEVRPRWSVALQAAVSGRGLRVLDNAMVGERVAAGTTLVAIENSPYVADLAAAKMALQEAELALWKAKNATAVARKQYQRTGKKPPNDLALHLPELEIANSAVVSSQTRVAAAQQRLDDTQVTAPFSGFVTERYISLGQTAAAGERLLKLVDDQVFELTVELGQRDWQLLQRPFAGLNAQVLNQNGDIIAQASIRQGGGFLDETTRQYKVFLAIKQPGPAVLSGDFVRVQLPGVTVPAALNVPESALTQEGYLWYLDADSRLQRLTPTTLFRRNGRLIIEAPVGASVWRIATTPLASFLPGQQVLGQEIAKGE